MEPQEKSPHRLTWEEKMYSGVRGVVSLVAASILVTLLLVLLRDMLTMDPSSPRWFRLPFLVGGHMTLLTVLLVRYHAYLLRRTKKKDPEEQ